MGIRIALLVLLCAATVCSAQTDGEAMAFGVDDASPADGVVRMHAERAAKHRRAAAKLFKKLEAAEAATQAAEFSGPVKPKLTGLQGQALQDALQEVGATTISRCLACCRQQTTCSPRSTCVRCVCRVITGMAGYMHRWGRLIDRKASHLKRRVVGPSWT